MVTMSDHGGKRIGLAIIIFSILCKFTAVSFIRDVKGEASWGF